MSVKTRSTSCITKPDGFGGFAPYTAEGLENDLFERLDIRWDRVDYSPPAPPVWDEDFCLGDTLEIARTLATVHINRCSEKENAVVQSIKKALDSADYRSLAVEIGPDYRNTVPVYDLINVRQALGFFQKLECLDLGVDKQAVAMSKFIEAEALCRETNALFKAHAAGSFSFDPDVDSILHAAQRKIARVLGSVPRLSELRTAFGPGATTSVVKRNACSRTKLSSVPSCSTNFVTSLPDFFGSHLPWFESLSGGPYQDGDEDVQQVTVEIHDGALAFVPKNAKTYRSVMTEPTINTMVQKGFGAYIAKRLLSVGQDVKDQTLNQRLAREGSLTGELATLDLSSASDTISRELVHHLLPIDWFNQLFSASTNRCRYPDGSVHTLEKFSSMGNGFTFPLQTLIFWALASSACSSSYAQVYGDDIICRSESVPSILKVFHACGFLINKEKSYWTGSFRESCGKDYFAGISIRPFYLKSSLSYEKLFLLHNYYVRNYEDELAALVLKWIPVDIQLWGPDGFGDGHLIGEHPRSSYRRRDGWGGWLFDTYSKTGRFHKKPMSGDSVLPAYSIYVRGEEPSTKLGKTKRGVPEVPLPGSKGYKRLRVYTLT